MATRRLPLPVVLVATALALVAALVTFAVLDDGDSGDDAGASDPAQVELSPQGELPGSVAEVRLESLRGEPEQALGTLLTGKPVVVNFFASWCAPCVDEMPAIENVHQAVGDQVTIVGLANTDGTDDALATVEATGVTYPTYADPAGDALTYFGGIAMPTTVFISPDGTVVDVHPGELDEAELRSELTQHFGIAA